MNDAGSFGNDRLEIAFVVYQGKKNWFRAPREMFVLDYVAWRQDFVSQGHAVPELDETDRAGLHVISEENFEDYFTFMSRYLVPKDQLKFEIATRYPMARNAWDVMDLLPIAYINFDGQFVAAFYQHGVKLERYVPVGWNGMFFDFLLEDGTYSMREEDKFWVHQGSDLLRLLNDRAKAND